MGNDMATYQQLQQLLNNPNARQMLDIIAKAEGVKHGYNTMFGNQRINSLQSHPNIRKSFVQTDGKSNVTTAAGRYQFLKGTWDGVARQYGLKDFSPRNQDIAALALMAQNGSLPYVLKGDFQTAVKKSGGTWASLPSSPYAQPKRSWSELGLNGGNAPQNKYQSQYLSAKDEARLFGKSQHQVTKQNYLSSDDEARLFPQQKPSTTNYLSIEDEARLFQKNTSSPQQLSYLTPEQEAQLFPGG
jgi:muramidase (phage lysozyme)